MFFSLVSNTSFIKLFKKALSNFGHNLTISHLINDLVKYAGIVSLNKIRFVTATTEQWLNSS